MIRIIDCGSQLTQNIARRIREAGVHSTIVPFKASLENILAGNPEGLIISGGQYSVYDPNSPRVDPKVLGCGVPVLGICYGQQLIAFMLSGNVVSTKNREYGDQRITLHDNPLSGRSPLFQGIAENNFVVRMSHGDVVQTLPYGFARTSESESGHISSMEKGNIYAVQFHPEVDHTTHGREILNNFVFNICHAKKDWNQDDFISSTIESIRQKVGDDRVIGGVSGGVDSSVASTLLARALGDRFTPIFVDNGLLRLGEGEEVKTSLMPLMPNLIYIDASARFLEKLRGIVNPDEKRKIIGNEFIYVFEEAARRIPGVKWLEQGTLYPDVIESVPVYGSSGKIKRHHNVGGLPEKMGLGLIEPFRDLFKDEVRQVGLKLGVPEDIVWRHPFPGPGLAVRVIGDITPGKLDILKKADTIFIEELKKRNLYRNIAQAFAVYTGASSVGVMGDGHTYESVIALRAVTTNDFMTSNVYNFEWHDLQAISNRIINEVRGVNRVVYDMSQKPPSTIEWE